MNFFNVLVHGTPVGENSVTEDAGKLLAVVQRLAVCLQV